MGEIIHKKEGYDNYGWIGNINPLKWMGGIILLVVFLVLMGTGMFQGLIKFGNAISSIPRFVWIGLIIMFFVFFAMGSGKSRRIR